MNLMFNSLAQSIWMPRQNSTVAADVDWLFYFILYLSGFFFVLITGLMAYFVLRYRHGVVKHQAHDTRPTHSLTLELTWTIIPSILVLLIFYWGFKGYLGMAVVPNSEDALEIQVRAQKWNWMFIYPGGVMHPELHIPRNTPVRLVMSSDDVIHSLYVPEFRLKKDAVPGRFNKFWVKAPETTLNAEGTHEPLLAYCTEYCGTNHSAMLTKVYVHDQAGFDAFLADAGNLFKPDRTWAEVGELLYQRRGCMGCHTIDGSQGVGPSFQNLFGNEQPMADGSRVLADEAYILESIRYPKAKVHEGYNPVMNAYPETGPGALSAREVKAITWYLKTISDGYTGPKPELIGEGEGADGDPDGKTAGNTPENGGTPENTQD